jgi:putative inorganic carbon (HCO3(-)) transporter
MLPVSKNSDRMSYTGARSNRWLVPLLAGMAVLLAYLLSKEMLLGVGVFAGVLGLAVVVVCMLNIELGLYINICYSFFVCHFSREFFDYNFPVGIASNVLVISTFLGLFNPKYNIRKSFDAFARAPVARIFLINLAFICIELFNPLAHSFEGWYATFRQVLMTALLLFVSYNVFGDYKRIRRFLIVLFVLSVIVAGYGCFQQWHGLLDFELNWVTEDPTRFALIYIAGDFRKFSTMPDPASFAIDMSSIAVFFIILLTGRWKNKNRLVLLGGVLLLVLGMAYSGTRTANAMLLGGLVMFILLTIDRRATIWFAGVSALAFLVLLLGPFGGNPTVNRFRTTFSGQKDESYNVREQNRKFVQPYIYHHPIGGGLGTTGEYGAKVNPGHFLAGFPTDSGYLRKALEIGWIGLFLVLLLYYSILRAAIRGYFQCSNPRARLIYAAAAGYFFSFYVAEFAQDAVGQVTDIVVYYPMIALVLQLKNHEKEMPLTQQLQTPQPRIT